MRYILSYQVARSPVGFPANLRGKNQQNTEKFCIVILVVFKGVGNAISYNNNKFTTQKIDFCANCPIKKLKKSYKWLPFLPFVTKIRGLTASTIPRPKDIFT